nr:PREDICTED: uncharacterized protein LOC104046637 [Phalacrocorax carbo]
MQQPSSDYSLDLVKETCISVEFLNREAELHKGNVAVSGSSSPEDVFGPCETQAVSVCMDTTMTPGDYVRRQGYTESSLLKLPTEECTGSHHGPFQFDRHALARISTSPTLRRLRMASASQALSFQDCSDAAQLGNQKEYTGSLHHICKSPPRCTTASSLSLPSCVHAKLLSSKAKSETTIAESARPRSKKIRSSLAVPMRHSRTLGEPTLLRCLGDSPTLALHHRRSFSSINEQAAVQSFLRKRNTGSVSANVSKDNQAREELALNLSRAANYCPAIPHNFTPKEKHCISQVALSLTCKLYFTQYFSWTIRELCTRHQLPKGLMFGLAVSNFSLKNVKHLIILSDILQTFVGGKWEQRS